MDVTLPSSKVFKSAQIDLRVVPLTSMKRGRVNVTVTVANFHVTIEKAEVREISCPNKNSASLGVSESMNLVRNENHQVRLLSNDRSPHRQVRFERLAIACHSSISEEGGEFSSAARGVTPF